MKALEERLSPCGDPTKALNSAEYPVCNVRFELSVSQKQILQDGTHPHHSQPGLEHLESLMQLDAMSKALDMTGHFAEVLVLGHNHRSKHTLFLLLLIGPLIL